MLIKKYLPYLKIFSAEIICMILELSASYLSYPYFGNANSVWVSIITTILLGSCIGNIIGGKLCKKSGKDYTVFSFLLASVFISFILIFSDNLFPVISSVFKNNTLSAFIASLILFLPSAICFGTIPPQIMYKESQKKTYTGINTGFVYALSTFGGIIGTIIGGFVLVPLFGCKTIIVICIILCLILSFSDIKIFKNTKATLCMILSITSILISIFSNIENSGWLNKPYGSAVFDSQYNRITVQNYIINNKPSRIMTMASGFESATYTDKDKYELIFEYLKDFDKYTFQNEKIKTKKTLLIGGAAYQFPKYIISHYKNKNIDVVEIDPEVTKLAKKYFFLQSCIDEYDKENKRLKLINDDGRVFLDNTNNKYDVIFNDAFAGLSPVATLSTLEFAEIVKNKLNHNGLYVSNIIAGNNVENQKFLNSECYTLSFVFKNVCIIKCKDEDETNNLSNFVVIATDNDLFKNNFSKTDNDILLTDNFCPVDSLSAKR